MSTFTGPDRYQQEAQERASFYSNISRRLKDIQTRLQELVEEEEASRIADSDLAPLSLSVEVEESMIDNKSDVFPTTSLVLILQNDGGNGEVKEGCEESEMVASSYVMDHAFHFCTPGVCQNAYEIWLNKPPSFPPDAVLNTHPTFSRDPVPFSLFPRLSNKLGLEAAVETAVEFLALSNCDTTCIEGVRQNAYEKLVFYFPPAKPPDTAGILLVSCDTLCFTLYWGIALASIQKNKSLSRTSIKTCLMFHDLFVADDRVAPEIKREVSYVITMDSYFNESHMIPMKDAETFCLIRMVLLFYQATGYLSELNRSHSSSMLELLQAFFNGIATPDLYNYSEKDLDSYWWQFTSWVTINGNLKVSGVQLWSSLIWYVCISSIFKNSIIQHSFWMAYVCCEFFYCWSWLFYELENFLKHVLIDTETIDTGFILRFSLKKLQVSINFTASHHDLNGTAVLYRQTVSGKAPLSWQYVVETMIIKALDADYSKEARFIPFESHILASLNIELLRCAIIEVKELYADSSISQTIAALVCLDAMLMNAYGKCWDTDNKEHQLATITRLLDSDTKPSDMVGLLIILSRENVTVEYLPCTIYYKMHLLSKWLGQSGDGCVLIMRERFDAIFIHHFEEIDKIDWVDVKSYTESFHAWVNKGIKLLGMNRSILRSFVGIRHNYLVNEVNKPRKVWRKTDALIKQVAHKLREEIKRINMDVLGTAGVSTVSYATNDIYAWLLIDSGLAWFNEILMFSSPRPPELMLLLLNLEDKVLRWRMQCYV